MFGGILLKQKQMCNAANEDFKSAIMADGTVVKPKANHFTACLKIKNAPKGCFTNLKQEKTPLCTKFQTTTAFKTGL
jgi:hypothetical protein